MTTTASPFNGVFKIDDTGGTPQDISAQVTEVSPSWDMGLQSVEVLGTRLLALGRLEREVPAADFLARAVGTLREALRNVSGLSFNAAEGGRSGDNMMLRGFYTFGDIYLDGIRDTAQYNREVFNLEQVDVLRGAASMLFGRSAAGGVIE